MSYGHAGFLARVIEDKCTKPSHWLAKTAAKIEPDPPSTSIQAESEPIPDKA